LRGLPSASVNLKATNYTNAKGQRTSQMLYDHNADLYENVNVSEIRKKLALELTDELCKRMGRDKTETILGDR
jgi:hypothetical protein